MIDLDESVPLGHAKQWLRDRVEDGAECPCCTQYAKVYRRKINSGMARALINQWRAAGQQLVHTKDLWLKFSKEAAQLQWWGLIAQDQTPRDDGGQSGWWNITDLGADFIRNRLSVPKYAYVYDGRLLRLDTSKSVNIIDCLGTRFDYQELMGNL